MKRKKYLIIFLLLNTLISVAQAGRGVYKFLDLPVSSRLAAMGGSNISLRDNDLNFSMMNPSLLTYETDKMLSVNIANYLSDITFGSVAFGKNWDNKNLSAISIQYVDYGKFQGYNELGDSTGAFSAKDFSLNACYARPLDEFWTVGGSFKAIVSNLENYLSLGVAFDLGVNYQSTDKLFGAGLVLRNIGTQLKSYYSNENGQHYEKLPFDIQLGVTRKLEHAPLRFSFTLNNLHKWDLSYQSTNFPIYSSEATAKSSFLDMAFRHCIIAAEFVPSKNFYLLASYNHRRYKEMQIDGFKSMAGFSFGAGIKLSKFHVGFGMSQFQFGNYAYQFSISTSLNEFSL